MQLELFSSKIPLGRAACFTGHRELPRGQELLALHSKLLAEIDRAVSDGITVFFAGGAVGFDMLAAEAIAKLQATYPALQLVLALPCRNHDKSWCDDDRDRLAEIITSGAQVIFVSDEYTTTAMTKRNRFMVDNSELVIAYFDGNPRTGTGATVRYAANTGKKVIIL